MCPNLCYSDSCTHIGLGLVCCVLVYVFKFPTLLICYYMKFVNIVAQNEGLKCPYLWCSVYQTWILKGNMSSSSVQRTYVNDYELTPLFLCFKFFEIFGRGGLEVCSLLMAPTFSLSVVFFLNEGHTTMNCPHRVATEHGVVPAPRKSTRHSVDYIFERQLRPHVPAVSCL